MKISKSKQELARIISENGGWRDGYFAAQGQNGFVYFYFSKPRKSGDFWHGSDTPTKSIEAKKLANWHQSCLSREEYFHLYPAPDDDGWIEWKGGECPVGEDDIIDVRFGDGYELFGVDRDWHWGDAADDGNIIAHRQHKPGQTEPEFCESVMRSIPDPEAKPTIEQLAADYQTKLDIATRAQEEEDAHRCGAEVALSKLEIAVNALGFKIEPITAKQESEPEPMIAVQVGDEVECVESNIKRDKYNGMVGRLRLIDEDDTSTPYLVDFGGEAKIWCHAVKFIRRP